MSHLPDTPRFTSQHIAVIINRSERTARRCLQLWRPRHEGQWRLTQQEMLAFVSYYHRQITSADAAKAHGKMAVSCIG